MIIGRPILLASCWLLLSATGRAEDLFSIAGQVTSETTGAPVMRALVKLEGWLAGVAPGRAERFVPRESFTDASGAFRFDGLPKGAFTVRAQKPQFQPKFNIGPDSIQIGPSRENVSVMLTPLSVVYGKVTDAGGRPMQGVQIRAYSSRVSDGRRMLTQTRSVTTDDRGQYRLWNLTAEKLYIKAVGRAGGTALYMADRAPTYPSTESFAPVYFGGANRHELATPIQVLAGQEMQADFRLSLEPAFKIRGVVNNLQPYKIARFELLSGGEDVAANRASLNATNGVFEVHDVVPGTYRLRITQGEKPDIVVAEEAVTLSSGDIPRLLMRAHGSVDLAIRVELSGEVAAEGPFVILNQLGLSPAPRNPSHCQVTLTSATDVKESFRSISDEAAGGSKIPALPAGEYAVAVNCGDAYVSGMMLGGTDVVAAQRLIIAPGTQPPPLVIQGLRNGGRLEVIREGAAAANSLQPLLVPSFPTAEGPRLVYGGFAGTPVQIGNLAPGEYTLYMVHGMEFPYRDPEARKQLSGGVTVRISAGETAKATIRETSQ